MSEKRKPVFTILLKMPGKNKTENQKFELYNASDFRQNYKEEMFVCADRYRIRYNGKWIKKKGGKITLYTWNTFIEHFRINANEPIKEESND